jgi:glycine cleavage system aminomethyltransferase T
MWGVDPRRFGPSATRGYLKEKTEEAYANVFTVHYPDEERAAARPLRRAPCHDRMAALGAVFGASYGWERPNWFAPEGYGLDEADLDKPDVLGASSPCCARGRSGSNSSAWARPSTTTSTISRLRPRDGSVDLHRVTTQTGVLVVAGPRARDVIQGLTSADLSTAAFPWLTGKTIDLGHATPRRGRCG